MTIQNSDADQVRLAYQLFLEALEKNTVEDLIEAAYAVFKRPVLITDETYHLICMYPQQRLGFPIWDTLYEQNTLPLDTIVEYQKAFLENMSKIYDPFFADYGLAKETPVSSARFIPQTSRFWDMWQFSWLEQNCRTMIWFSPKFL